MQDPNIMPSSRLDCPLSLKTPNMGNTGVDTMGLLLAVVVHPANIQDRDGAKLVIDIGRFPRFRLKGQPKRDGGIIVRSCKASQRDSYSRGIGRP